MAGASPFGIAGVPTLLAAGTVAAGSAHERVVTPAAVQAIVAGAAVELVPAGAAPQDVVAAQAADDVVAGGADQPVVASGAGDRAANPHRLCRGAGAAVVGSADVGSSRRAPGSQAKRRSSPRDPASGKCRLRSVLLRVPPMALVNACGPTPSGASTTFTA